MMLHVALTLKLAAILTSAAPVVWPVPDSGSDGEAAEFFERNIRPLLAENCFQCHSARRQRAGLRLDSREFMLKGGDRGPAVVPGKPEQSRLIKAVEHADEELKMPPKGRLKDGQVAALKNWVKMGAPWPDQSNESPAPAVQEFDLARRRSEHWAWQPIQSRSPPEVADRGWPRSSLDHFILAGLETAGLNPASQADKRTLIRRAYFDLIGLPPEPHQVEEFLADESPGAFAKVVDGLLASPHFGERWARHWLDLVRYAETRGHEFDHLIPNAYQYRDYVIRALNADVPYDQFVTEHIAGDLVEKPRLHPTEGFNESILGTGFWFLGEEVHSPVDIRGDETDRIDNKIDVMTKTFLGLTVACARCHEHKFDAISTKDYYSLTGFLLSSSYRQVPFESMEQNRRIARELESLREKHRPAIVRSVADTQRPSVEQLAEYLMAARDAIQSGVAPPSAERASGERLQAFAAKHSLDAERLAKWLDHLHSARQDVADPFHPWALLAFAGENIDSAKRAQLLRTLIDGWNKKNSLPNDSLNSSRVIVDYANLRACEWLQDGVAFGPRACRPGDVRFGSDSARPIVEIYHRAAARYDTTWDLLQLAPETERDPGKVAWLQAGRTLRTPTATLGSGKLFYLTQGSGHAFAAVDSHRLIAGPLHGSLVRSWDGAPGGKPQWIEHNLCDYRGQRVHMEFSPKEPDASKPVSTSEFAILKVVESDQPPPEPPLPGRWLARLLTDGAEKPAESLAQSFEQIFLRVNRELGADTVADSPDAMDLAWLANWVFAHPELFPSDSNAADRIAQTSKAFLERQAELVAQIKRSSHTAPALLDGNGVDEFVLVRGNHRKPGERVPRRFLEALKGSESMADEFGSGRLNLARQMTDPTNPLVARVMANRVWHHLFGRGIVASPDNFGVLGERPAHPELLDFLAARFVEHGWSIKKLIREIVLSSTYQMSGQPDPRAVQADARNLLFHHMPVRRLEGEAIRDAILLVSGRLDRTMFGPSVEVYLTPFLEGRGRPQTSGPLDGAGRRSVYLRVRRNFLDPLQLAFDAPVPFTTIGRRIVSNVPAQALALMNGPFVVEQAKHWATRVLAEKNRTDEARVNELYMMAFNRPPSPTELHDATGFLGEQWTRYASGLEDVRPWADLCHVLMNAKEFIFIQ